MIISKIGDGGAVVVITGREASLLRRALDIATGGIPDGPPISNMIEDGINVQDLGDELAIIADEK